MSAGFDALSQKKTKKSVIMPMGNGTYMVTFRGATGFTPLGKLRRKAFEYAEKYAKENKGEIEVISVNEVPQSFGVWPQIDLKFRLVLESEKISNNNATTITSSSGYSAIGKKTDSQITINKSKNKEEEKYKKLEQIGKLFKDGILTKEEFEAEKKKILKDN